MMKGKAAGPGWFAKLSIALFSLIVCVVLAEVGLRFAGRMYERQRQGQEPVFFSPRSYIEFDGKEPRLEHEQIFLGMGDSYTHNGNVPKEKSWCATLQTQLNDQCVKIPFYVLNGGVCEYNSSQLVAKVEEYLPRFKPNVLIILSGSSNRFNLALTEGRFDSHPWLNYFRSLRIFKILRGIYLNYKSRGINIDIQSEILKNDKFATVYGYDKALRAFKDMDQFTNMGKDGYPKVSFHNLFVNYYKALPLDSAENRVWSLLEEKKPDQALKQCKQALAKMPDDMRLECLLAWCQFKDHKARKAAKTYKKLLKKYPSTSFVQAHVAEFYHALGNAMCSELNYDEAVKLYLKAITFDPYEYSGLYLLEKVYPMQSRYDAQQIVKQFQDMIKQNPRLKSNTMLLNYMKYFQNRELWENRVYEWLEEDLVKIIKLCRKYNVKLVMQNYPFPFKKANETLEKVATQYKIPFVDNYSVFSKLTQPGAENWPTYFADDDHCSALGYRIMKDNVFKVLVDNGIVELYKHSSVSDDQKGN